MRERNNGFTFEGIVVNGMNTAKSGCLGSDGEPEMHYVPVFYYVIFSFDP